MKTAVIYARYSCSSQTEQSIEGQMRVCNEYAKNNDLLIVDSYIDRAMTGTNDNRIAFQKMLKDSEKAKWDIVLIYAIDRFGRNATEIAINKHRLKKNGKILISATQRMSENIDGTKNLDGIILENMYIGIAEYYSAELSQKIRRGMNESRSKGQFCGGSIPYGYYAENKFVQIDEDKAKVVRFIFAEYSRGQTVPQIICKLNEQGILHNGKPFIPNALYQILRNERYKGIYHVNGIAYDNIFPKIVDADIYNIVRDRINKNRFGKKPVKTQYLLRYKLKCGYCGMPISAECGTSHTGEKKYYYKCLGRKKYKTNCEKTPVRRDVLEKLVLDSVIKALTNDKTVERIVNIIYDWQTKMQKENSQLVPLLKEQKQVETSLANIMNAIEKGIVSLTANKRIRELETRQQELEQKIAVERAKEMITFTKDELREFYKADIKLEPQMLINYFVREVILYNDEIVIHFNNPTMKAPDESQGFSFYEENHIVKVYMGNKRIFEEHKMKLIMSL